MEALLPAYRSVVKSWLKLELIKTFKSISRQHTTIAKYIETKENINGKKIHYQSLVSSLKNLNANPKIIKKYSDLSTKLARESDKQAGENQLHASRVEHFKTLSELVKIRDNLMKKDDRDFNDEMMLTVLMFSTHIPPRRSEIATTLVVDHMPSKVEDLEENLLVTTKTGYTWLLGKYKTRKTYGVTTIVLPKVLSSFLDKSFENYPRDWLLSDHTGKNPMKYPGLWKLLYSYLGKGQSIDCLRSAFASDKINQYTTNQIDELGKAMGTSSNMLMRAYRKLDVTSSDSD